MKQQNVYYCCSHLRPADTGWGGINLSSGKSFGHATGGSRSEFGFVGVFIPCRLQHGSWSWPKLSTVYCLRRSEVVVLKYVATLNGFMFLYVVLWPKSSFIKQTVAIAPYSK